MKRDMASFGVICFMALSLLTSASAKEFQGASYQDIISSLGPDALGLNFVAERLPDFNELEASRLAGQGEKFIVEHPYTGGRWKGGKALVEYARDLSYATVSIYDKDGKRQRIYSVKARPREKPINVAQLSPSEQAELNSPTESKSAEHFPEASVPEKQETSTPLPSLVPATPQEIPPAVSTKKQKVKKIKKASRLDPDQPASDAELAADAAAQSSGFEWNDQAGAYIPVGGGTAAANLTPDMVPAFQPSPADESQAAPVSRRKGRKSSTSDSGSMADSGTAKSGRVTVASLPSGYAVPPAAPYKPAVTRASPATTSSGEQITSGDVPTTDELLGTNTGAEGAGGPAPRKHERLPTAQQADTSSPWDTVPEASSSSKSKRHKKSIAGKPSLESPAASSPGPGAAPGDDWVPREAPLTAEKPEAAEPEVRDVNVPNHGGSKDPGLDSDGWMPRPDDKRQTAPDKPLPEPKSHSSKKRSKDAVDDQSAAPQTLDSDQWQPKATPPGRALPDSDFQVPQPKSSSRTKPADAFPDNYSAQSQPLESDNWKPKATAKPAPMPDIPEVPVQVAMVPKHSPPPDNSLEALLNAAQKRQNVGGEGDSWSPKNVPVANPDADLNAELSRLRAQQKPVPKVVVKVNRDVNNPEEGVLPVNSMEKFSGPRYGRHREFERRLFFGKKAESPIKTAEYDFYVDEVDRKREIHNIYYYKKGKIPKLVAVEKHDRVSFLSNYDVDKEDKGKITRG